MPGTNVEEGITLALGALAERMQKSDSLMERFLMKQEADEEREEREKEEEMEKSQYSAMVKAIAAEVKKELQPTIDTIEKQVLDLGATKSKKVSGTKWPMSSGADAGDKAEMKADVLTGNKTEGAAQLPIEAMEKQLPPMPPMEDEEELDEDSEEYPMEEEPAPDMEEPEDMEKEYSDTEVRNMSRMVKELRKQVLKLEKGRDSDIKKQVDLRLKKAGWREEATGQVQKLTGVGMGLTPIQKSEEAEDTVERLSKMSFSDLIELRERTEALARTDPSQLPQEFIQRGA